MTKLGRWFRENLKLNDLVALQFVAEIPQKAKQIHEIIFSITVTSSSYKAPPTKGHTSYKATPLTSTSHQRPPLILGQISEALR